MSNTGVFIVVFVCNPSSLSPLSTHVKFQSFEPGGGRAVTAMGMYLLVEFIYLVFARIPVRVTVGKLGLCCRVCVRSVEHCSP